ncbi:MAG: hypothetical protein HFH68_01455 [Lachnospiraceae bacterium]|nr:hypothetical protein [Lachnospiraceae bacterium]
MEAIIDFVENNKKLKFMLENSFSSFLFVVSNSENMLENVYSKINQTRDCSHIRLGTESLILEEISGAVNDYLFITFDEEFEILAERITYMRDSLYVSGKCLIFGFLSSQLSYLQQNYPDFGSYSMIVLDYTVIYDVPFSLLLSNDVTYTNFKEFYTANADSVKSLEYDGDNVLDYIEYKLKQFRYVRLNDIELKQLNKKILNCLDSATVFLGLSFGKSDIVYPKYHENYLPVVYRIIDFTLDYLDILRLRNKMQYIEPFIIPLFSAIIMVCFCGSLKLEIKNIYSILFAVKEMINLNVSLKKKSAGWIDAFLACLLYFVLENNDVRTARELNAVHISFLFTYRHFFSYSSVFKYYNDYAILDIWERKQVKDLSGYYKNYVHLSNDSGIQEVFTYYYNIAVINLMDCKVADAKNSCNSFFNWCDDNSFINSILYYRMKILSSWIIGVYEGRCRCALKDNLETLKIQREIFPENHYSIAETHYCNAIFYFNICKNEACLNCARKAKNIISFYTRDDRKKFKKLIDELLILLQ